MKGGKVARAVVLVRERTPANIIELRGPGMRATGHFVDNPIYGNSIDDFAEAWEYSD
jgi:hypothetical protein